MRRNIVLLGDSIFDNQSYVPNGLAVADHLQGLLPDGDRATLLAVDGAVVGSVPRQLDRLPASATHLVLSVGGNDALAMAGRIFPQPCRNLREGVGKIFQECQTFHVSYRQLVETLLACGLPLTLLTIYDAIPGLGPAELGGLCVFNDIITRTAFEKGTNLIYLRILCSDETDYSPLSPIEPSDEGGRKIASAVLRSVEQSRSGSQIYARADSDD